jgi:lipopolysaccharide export system permease protein
MRLLYRYIILELLTPFCLSFLVLTFVLLMGKLLNLADILLEKGVEGIIFFKIIGSLALTLTGLTLPLAFLVGIMICFGRLSRDNEILALRTCGISVFKMFLPVVLFCSFLLGFAFLLQTRYVPQVKWNMMCQLRSLSEFSSDSFLQEKVWLQGFGNSSIYVKNIHAENHFRGVEIHQLVPNFTLPRVITADRGHFSFEESTRLITFNLQNGSIDEPSNNSQNPFHRILFKTYTLVMPITGKEFEKPRKKDTQLTSPEIDARLKITPHAQIDYRHLVLEKHHRLCMVFSVFIFMLLGFPLSLQLKNLETSTNVLVAAGLALSWYLLLLLGNGFSIAGYGHPYFFVWIPNIVMGVLGLYLTLRILRM